MGKVICDVCGREIDSRGMSGHMRTHKGKAKKDDTDSGVISYPSGDELTHPEGDESIDKIDAQGKPVKKTVKKQVEPASKPASSPASSPPGKPDPRGQRKTETEHKADLKSAAHPKDSGAKEWQGLFRD